jgi:hypothetical protein
VLVPYPMVRFLTACPPFSPFGEGFYAPDQEDTPYKFPRELLHYLPGFLSLSFIPSSPPGQRRLPRWLEQSMSPPCGS